jgi:hypothetical protein
VEGAVLTLGRAQLAAGWVDQARTLLDGINEPLEHFSAQGIPAAPPRRHHQTVGRRPGRR